ncbi:ribosomal protein L7/L12 [Nocardiopsis sp. CNT-189]|uniref:ribosomal protein L7/L12 n=1 Tax=Nocardiopsis oceanisediminis TaxID=2816862 RepID=UPI003B2DBA71
MSRNPHRDAFDRALGRLSAGFWTVVDAERFESDTGTGGLLSLPGDLAGRFGPDGALLGDVAIRCRGGVAPMLQSAFAREGLVLALPERGPGDGGRYAAAMAEPRAWEDGAVGPEEWTAVCPAGGRTSDLCRITGAFDRLAGHGYIAEPALWPTTSGCWEHVRGRTVDGRPPRAVFWNTQSHDACFDPRGDLADELYVHWAGDRDLIAEALAGTGLEVEVPGSEGHAFVVRPVGHIGWDAEVDVVLESAGAEWARVVRAVRRVASGLGILEARELVRNAPKPVLENVALSTAAAAKEALEAAGATVAVERSRAGRGRPGGAWSGTAV